jgi:hypothetical protein
MKRFFAALILLSLSASLVFGKARIRVADRVPNQDPGYCAWACIEMLCRHQGIKAGYGLVESRKKDPDETLLDGTFVPHNLGTDPTIRRKLDSLHIRYHMHPSLVKDQAGIDLIMKTVKEGRGVLVVFYHGEPTTRGCHAVIITDWGENTYDFLDPNNIKVIYEGTHEWFLQEWTGFVLTIDK